MNEHAYIIPSSRQYSSVRDRPVGAYAKAPTDRQLTQPPRTRRRPPMSIVVNVFLFFALLPFISPLPTTSDVQFPAFVMAALIIGWDLLKQRIRFDWVDLAFFSVAIWSFCYVLPSGEFVLRQRAGLLMAFVIYFVVKRHAALFSPRTVYVAIVVGFMGTMVQWLWPAVFLNFAPRIIRTVKDIDNVRGLGGLSAEPSFLSEMALVQGLLLYDYYRNGRTSGRMLTFGWALVFAMILLSKSATGFVTLLSVCAIFLLYFALRGLPLSVWVGATALIVAGVLLLTGPMASTRGGAVLVNLYDRPSLIFADGSFQERTGNLFLGGTAFLHHPLGVGGGGYENAAKEMAALYHAERIFENATPSALGAVLSSMGFYLAELGLPFVFLLAVVFWPSLRAEPLHLSYCFLALTFISGTFSITCPLIWLMLGMSGRPGGLRARAGAALA
jgi:hypothetical protein